jgi:hypothetical protein
MISEAATVIRHISYLSAHIDSIHSSEEVAGQRSDSVQLVGDLDRLLWAVHHEHRRDERTWH